jgi:hypothetical protein
MASRTHHRLHIKRFASVYRAMRRFLGVSSGWVRLGGYRPEKHYMRGPGPKSRSRQGNRERASKIP